MTYFGRQKSKFFYLKDDSFHPLDESNTEVQETVYLSEYDEMIHEESHVEGSVM